MSGEGERARNAGTAPEWVRILDRRVPAFGRLTADDQRQFGTLLKRFLAETLSKAEFFAAASEAFFERPAQMAQRMPSLFHKLKRFHGQDPRTYSESY